MRILGGCDFNRTEEELGNEGWCWAGLGKGPLEKQTSRSSKVDVKIFAEMNGGSFVFPEQAVGSEQELQGDADSNEGKTHVPGGGGNLAEQGGGLSALGSWFLSSWKPPCRL